MPPWFVWLNQEERDKKSEKSCTPIFEKELKDNILEWTHPKQFEGWWIIDFFRGDAH